MAQTNETIHKRVSVRSTDGVELQGDAWGTEQGKPVLLLHGGGQTRHAWKGTARTLAERGHYAVSLDLRGHGGSGWSDNARYDSEAFLGDMAAMLPLFSSPPVIIGASLGGIVSLLFLGEQTKAIAKALVLVDIATRAEQKGVERILAFMENHQNGFDSMEEAGAAVAAYLHHRKPPSVLDGLHNNLRKRDDGRYYWHWDPAMLLDKNLGELSNHTRLETAARALALPVLLIRGSRSDVLTTEIVDEFLVLVPHAKFIDVAGASHMVSGDSNDVFTDAVLKFLESIDA